MKGLFAFAVSLLISLTKAQTATQCTSENVQICTANMQQFELDEYEAIVPIFTEAELDDMCTEYQVTDVCIDALIDTCTAYYQYYYRAVENNWNYICEDKKEEYLDNRDCLARDALHTQAETHCTNVWDTRVTALDEEKFRHTTGRLNADGISSLCNAATEYLDCVYTEVELECGAEAAAWQRGFDDTLIQPILQLVGCGAGPGTVGQAYFYDPNLCTKGNADACVQHIDQSDQDDAIVPSWTEAELEQRCSEYQVADECIDKLIGNCSAYDQHYYRGVEDSWNYLCEDKKQEYLDLEDCLSRESVHSRTEAHCTNIWKQRVRDLNLDASRILDEDEKSRFCNVATEYLNCAYTEVELECGADAATWRREYMEAIDEPLFQFFGCQTRAGRLGKVYYYGTIPDEQDDNGALGLNSNGLFVLGLTTASLSFYF